MHSVIGEATDTFTQTEVDEVDVALKNAEKGTSSSSNRGGGDNSRGFLGIGGSSSKGAGDFISLVAKLPGVGDGFASQAKDLQAQSDAQERENEQRSRASGGTNPNVVPGMSPDFDPVKTAGRIYPILQFRDKIVKAISRGIAKVPGLEKLLNHISETLTAFILGLLAPFIRPIIKAVSKQLKDGSSGIISASARSQLEPWENPRCSDPTHSMLAKDHFTNILNSCAGRVAVTILQYAVPRILYAWENTSVPVDEVCSDILRSFHHPALRSEKIDIQRDMFRTVRKWADEHPRRNQIDNILSSQSVRAGKNHVLNQKQHGGQDDHNYHGGDHSHSHGALESMLGKFGHGKVSGSLWSQVRTRDMDAMEGRDSAPMSNSPAPPPQSFDYGQNPSYQQGGGYNAPPPQAGQYNSGYDAQPPPPHQGYGPPQGYGAPSGPPQGYGAPPGPPQGYGAPPPGGYAPPYGAPHGYGAPPPGGHQPHYAPQGGPPPPGWQQYPGQGPRY